MDFFSVLTLLGGLGLFLYGMIQMSQGLQKLAGGRMQDILEKLSSNRVKGLLLGAGVTAAIQSSSATTVMVVGFVNSGIMKLSQVVGIIIGANIGTTITAWMLSLTGIERGNFFMQMLRPANFSLVFLIVGAFFIMFMKKGKKPTVGQILIGLAVIFIGMGMMTQATAPLQDNETFQQMLLLFQNPFFGVLAGFILTAVVQSSSASLGILQALAVSVGMPFSVVLPIILGENIGTCATAMISSIGASKNARRAALIHLFFNSISSLIALFIVYTAQFFIQFDFFNENVVPATIAIIHSAFNVTFALAFLPFTPLLYKLVMAVIKDDKESGVDDSVEALTKMLDDRFVTTNPVVALEQSKQAIYNMANIAVNNVKLATALINNYEQENADIVSENESKLDAMDDKINNYIVRLKNLPPREDRSVSKLLHTIRDIERIGDHAENIKTVMSSINEQSIDFSEEGRKELNVLAQSVDDILKVTLNVLNNRNLELAEGIEPLEEVIDYLRIKFKERHILRLKDSNCTTEAAVAYNDIATDLERVADHCSNIALYVIEEAYESDGVKFESHKYVKEFRESKKFIKQFETHREKYLGMLGA